VLFNAKAGLEMARVLDRRAITPPHFSEHLETFDHEFNGAGLMNTHTLTVTRYFVN